MSTIVIYTSPARGHLYPMMDVALALKDAGHRVVAQTLAAEKDNVEAAGIEHRAIDPGIEALVLLDYQAKTPPQQLGRALECWAKRAPLEVKDLQKTIADTHADFLLVDANTWGAAAVAEAHANAAGLPWAMFLPYCLPVPSKDAPAFGPGFAPPKGPLGRLRDKMLWTVMGRVAKPHVKELNGLRKSLGLSPVQALADIYHRAPRLIYRTAEPFEYPRSDWPENVRAIGPGLWAPPGEVPDWLSNLPSPRVLVSVSTELQEDGAIIDAALEGLAEEKGSLIITTAALDPSTFKAPNDTVRVTRFLPHAQVIPQVDVVVTHGGMGTTQRALASGVPVCVIPWGRDQSESARRAEISGAGVFLPRNKLSGPAIKSAVQKALACKNGAERVARGFVDAGGASRGAAIVEELLGKSQGGQNGKKRAA